MLKYFLGYLWEEVENQYHYVEAILDPIVQVDLGPARDPWVELYGNSVLNNTLHDRLDRHKLQKSQSAVWTRNNEVWSLVTSMFRTEPSPCVR